MMDGSHPNGNKDSVMEIGSRMIVEHFPISPRQTNKIHKSIACRLINSSLHWATRLYHLCLDEAQIKRNIATGHVNNWKRNF